MDTVEIRVHPSNFQQVISDAWERGAKVSRRADGCYLIDELPVIVDSRLDVVCKDQHLPTGEGGTPRAGMGTHQ